MADLYDPEGMPPALVKAHQELDKAVDQAYRKEPFPNETNALSSFSSYMKNTQQDCLLKRRGRRKCYENENILLNKIRLN